MKKHSTTAILSLAGCLLVSAPHAVFASGVQQGAVPVLISAPISQAQEQPVKVTSKIVKEETAELSVELNIPVIQGMRDKRFQDEQNDMIERIAMKELDNIKKQALEGAEHAKEHGYPIHQYILKMDEKVTADGTGPGGLTSIKITTGTYTGGANGMTRVSSYNFRNEDEARSLYLKDLLGSDYKTIVDTKIKEEIARHPKNYFADSFKGISEQQPFYVENGDVVVFFSKYEIAPGAMGVPEFRIPLSLNTTGKTQLLINGQKLDLQEGETFTDKNGKTMVPLREVAEKLGYSVKWNADTFGAELNQGAQWTRVTVGNDAYFINKMAPRPLGSAPVIQPDEMMYVPIEFFTDVLHAQVAAE